MAQYNSKFCTSTSIKTDSGWILRVTDPITLVSLSGKVLQFKLAYIVFVVRLFLAGCQLLAYLQHEPTDLTFRCG